MKFFRSASNIIFLSVIVLLVAALTFSVFVILEKNEKIDKINAIVAESKEEIKHKTDIENELQKQLDESQSENNTLKEENGQLKTEIENLKAQKKAEAQAAVLAAQVKSPVPIGSKVCYLTFDDGPSHNTLQILNILERYGIKATFFVTNSDNASYIKTIYDKGHAIGLHCSVHDYARIYSSTDAYFADLEAINNTVKSLTGLETKLLRFPGGGSNMVSRQYSLGIMTELTKKVQELGYAYFDWNVDSTDASAARRSPHLIKNNVLAQARGKDAICVLMHDSSGKTTTVTALPAIIEGLVAQGFRFEALSTESPVFHHGVNN